MKRTNLATPSETPNQTGKTVSFPILTMLFCALLCSFSLFSETVGPQGSDNPAGNSKPYTDSYRSYTRPVVNNVSASQRTDGSKIVDIWYDLVDADGNLCDISFKLSNDGGGSFSIIPSPANVSGDFGSNVASGTNKHIEWHAGAETYILDASYLYRVYAQDGTTPPMPTSFIYVQGGTFSRQNHNGTYPSPPAMISLSPFYIDKYEVTQEGFQAVMGYNPSYFSGYPLRPVEQVSWCRAIEYCNRRSIQESLSPCYSYGTYGTNPDNWPMGWDTGYTNHMNVSCDWTSVGYRLPTEMEWMFAAKGGTQSMEYIYSGSNTIDNVARYLNNSGNRTGQVGLFAANELGTFDMSGNVQEWVWDISVTTYPSGNQTDPTGPVGGSNTWSRVVRGGAFPSGASSCCVYTRGQLNASSASISTGFRCVRCIP